MIVFGRKIGHVEPAKLPNLTFPGRTLSSKRLTSICAHPFARNWQLAGDVILIWLLMDPKIWFNTLKYSKKLLILLKGKPQLKQTTFSEKIRLGISCESYTKQTNHMKYQVLFSLKNNKINLALITTADGILNILLVSSVRLHMKCQVLFLWKK